VESNQISRSVPNKFGNDSPLTAVLHSIITDSSQPLISQQQEQLTWLPNLATSSSRKEALGTSATEDKYMPSRLW